MSTYKEATIVLADIKFRSALVGFFLMYLTFLLPIAYFLGKYLNNDITWIALINGAVTCAWISTGAFPFFIISFKAFDIKEINNKGASALMYLYVAISTFAILIAAYIQYEFNFDYIIIVRSFLIYRGLQWLVGIFIASRP